LANLKLSRRLLSLAVLASLQSCDAPDAPPVQSTLPVDSVSSVPIVRIGDFEGTANYSFGDIFSTLLLDSLGIVVVDWEPRSLVLYDFDGVYQRTIGRPGEGPGEFRSIFGMDVREPDTLRVIDMGSRRANTFSWNGELIGETSISVEEGHPDHLIGFLRDGGFVMGWANFGSEDGDIVSDVMSYGVFNADGSYRRRIVDVPGLRRIGQSEPINAYAIPGEHPLSSYASAVLVQDSLFYTDGFDEVTVYDLSGVAQRRFGLPPNPMPPIVARDEVARARDASGRETDFSGVPAMPATPSVSRMLYDGAGHLWLKRFDPAEDSPWVVRRHQLTGGEWLVVDLGGDVLRRVQMPIGFNPRHIRPGFAAGIYRDAYDVESVAVHSVPRIQ